MKLYLVVLGGSCLLLAFEPNMFCCKTLRRRIGQA